MFEHAVSLLQRQRNARHIANAKGNRIGIEGFIRQTKAFRVAFHKGEALQPALFGTFPAHAQHIGINIEHSDIGLRPARLDHAKGHIAGAARDIEMTKGLEARGLDHAHQHILPQAVQPAGHQVIHQIITVSHFVKHIIDHALLVVQRDIGKAEMGFMGCRHGSTPKCGGNNSAPARIRLCTWDKLPLGNCHARTARS